MYWYWVVFKIMHTYICNKEYILYFILYNAINKKINYKIFIEYKRKETGYVEDMEGIKQRNYNILIFDNNGICSYIEN